MTSSSVTFSILSWSNQSLNSSTTKSSLSGQNYLHQYSFWLLVTTISMSLSAFLGYIMGGFKGQAVIGSYISASTYLSSNDPYSLDDIVLESSRKNKIVPKNSSISRKSKTVLLTKLGVKFKSSTRSQETVPGSIRNDNSGRLLALETAKESSLEADLLTIVSFIQDGGQSQQQEKEEF